MEKEPGKDLTSDYIRSRLANIDATIMSMQVILVLLNQERPCLEVCLANPSTDNLYILENPRQENEQFIKSLRKLIKHGLTLKSAVESAVESAVSPATTNE